jgi:hypothetical protein
MTSETKHFIELSDVIALRLKCRHCNAELHVTLDELPRTDGALSICPNCKRPWATIHHNEFVPHDYQKELVGFMDVLLETKTIVANKNLGFTLTLGINNEQYAKEK